MSKMLLAAGLFLSLGTSASYAQEVCSYYAQGGCFLSKENAFVRASRVGGQVLADRHPAAAPGYFCVIRGPYYVRKAAAQEVLAYQEQGVRDAHVKEVCRDYEAQD